MSTLPRLRRSIRSRPSRPASWRGGPTTTGSWRQIRPGTTEGEDRLLRGRRTTADAYRDAVLATPQLASYWRLGKLAGDSGAGRLAGAPGRRCLAAATSRVGPGRSGRWPTRPASTG